MLENLARPFAELDTKQAVTGATAVCFDLTCLIRNYQAQRSKSNKRAEGARAFVLVYIQ